MRHPILQVATSGQEDNRAARMFTTALAKLQIIRFLRGERCEDWFSLILSRVPSVSPFMKLVLDCRSKRCRSWTWCQGGKHDAQKAFASSCVEMHRNANQWFQAHSHFIHLNFHLEGINASPDLDVSEAQAVALELRGRSASSCGSLRSCQKHLSIQFYHWNMLKMLKLGCCSHRYMMRYVMEFNGRGTSSWLKRIRCRSTPRSPRVNARPIGERLFCSSISSRKAVMSSMWSLRTRWSRRWRGASSSRGRWASSTTFGPKILSTLWAIHAPSVYWRSSTSGRRRVMSSRSSVSGVWRHMRP